MTFVPLLDLPPLRNAQALQSATPSFTAQHYNHAKAIEASKPLSCSSSCLCISFGRPTNTSVGKLIVDTLSGSAMSLVHPSQYRLGKVQRDSIQSPATKDETNPTPITTLPLLSLPTVYLPPTEKATFPRVVVVNPTPHPTPPATPISNSTSVYAQLPSMHLLPPLASPTLLAVASPKPPSTEPVNQIGQALSRPRSTRASKLDPTRSSGTKTADNTLKAADRRFFLQQQSPERESPERSADASTDDRRLSVGSDADCNGSRSCQKESIESERPVTVTAPTKPSRRTKEVVRNSHKPALRRAQTARHHPPTLKQQSSIDNSKHRPTFNIGSSSSNGSKSNPNCSGSSTKQTIPLPPVKEPSPPKRAPSPVKQLAKQPPGCRVVVDDSASSDYETTDSEDESWCSEEMSTEENEQSKEATRLKEAALEAQRQRDMFAKLPKRSYSNLDRTQSGLLTTLLNPDPNIFPPNHPYRASHSSENVTQLKQRNVPAGFTPMAPLTTVKGSAAIPQTSQAAAKALLPQGLVGDTYQPKGRPQHVEMEDSDSDDENGDDKIQVSRSVAQEKLAALAGRRAGDRVPPARPPQPAPPRPSLPTVNSAPIPFGHPYNLPAPAPPSTPRTTRRQMLSTELSESLRRNLLWQRQMNKNDVLPQQRRKSAITLNGGLQPLTMVAGGPSNNDGGSGSKPSTSHEGLNEADDEKTARMKRALARNRSWADDYHYSGW